MNHVEKLNKICDDRIEYHMELIDLHTNKIAKLQKQRISELKNLLTEINTLEDKSKQNNFENSLFNGLYPPSDNPDFNNSSDLTFDNQASDIPDLNNPSFDGDLGLSEQDLIWERIRQSQLAQKENETPEHNNLEKELLKVQTTVEKELLKTIPKQNNLPEVSPSQLLQSNIDVKPDMEVNPEEKKEKEDEKRPPKINALFRVNPLTRRKLIKDTFIQATENIKKLAELNDKYKDNFDEEVQKEADRLLDVYLKTH